MRVGERDRAMQSGRDKHVSKNAEAYRPVNVMRYASLTKGGKGREALKSTIELKRVRLSRVVVHATLATDQWNTDVPLQSTIGDMHQNRSIDHRSIDQQTSEPGVFKKTTPTVQHAQRPDTDYCSRGVLLITPRGITVLAPIGAQLVWSGSSLCVKPPSKTACYFPYWMYFIGNKKVHAYAGMIPLCVVAVASATISHWNTNHRPTPPVQSDVLRDIWVKKQSEAIQASNASTPALLNHLDSNASRCLWSMYTVYMISIQNINKICILLHA